MIIKYLRNKDNKPVGCVIVTDSAKVGWSLCCEKDTFTKKMAKTIALGRAEHGTHKPLPYKIETFYTKIFGKPGNA